MTTTAQYLRKALTSFVDRAFDPVLQRSDTVRYVDIVPKFQHEQLAPELGDENLSRSVQDALRAQDGPALEEGDYPGLQFHEESSHISDIVHSADCIKSCKESHTEWLDDDVADAFIMYSAIRASKPHENLHEYLRRALLTQGLCEWALMILFQSVQGIVKHIDPQAIVHQMVVAPRRRFQITRDGGSFAGTHSIFLIVSPLAGNFILDPTAEQYGIPREYRFIPWSVYKQLYIVDETKYRGCAVWSTDFEPYIQSLKTNPSHWRYWEAVRTVLDDQTATWLDHCELKTLMDDEG